MPQPENYTPYFTNPRGVICKVTTIAVNNRTFAQCDTTVNALTGGTLSGKMIKSIQYIGSATGTAFTGGIVICWHETIDPTL